MSVLFWFIFGIAAIVGSSRFAYWIALDDRYRPKEDIEPQARFLAITVALIALAIFSGITSCNFAMHLFP